MPIRIFICSKCEAKKRTFKEAPECCNQKMKMVMIPPHTKILEPTDIKRGKSDLKNADDILLERARDYAREQDLEDLIEKNDLETSAYQGWLSTDYKTKRKKVEGK